jgi:hypothetical protein
MDPDQDLISLMVADGTRHLSAGPVWWREMCLSVFTSRNDEEWLALLPGLCYMHRF